MDNGKPDKEAERLVQADVAAQEKRIRFEESVCGPKALAYLLPRLGKPALDYRELAKLCGTTDAGTSIDGMRKALKALGVPTFAFRLNRVDLARAPLPAIYLHFEHFVVIERIGRDFAEGYDAVAGHSLKIQLPSPDDRDFLADVILFSPPSLADS
jgi:ABC-type bacteriocin/lantibiotic exporter with double-glycine peptidase domain